MDVYKLSINKFITSGEVIFVIPVYQRNYDWKIESCTQLFDDIMGIIGNEGSHFLGTICDKMDGRYSRVIVDGQQRITSLMLLLKALHDLSDESFLKNKIMDMFLTNRYAPASRKFKLYPVEKDKDIYEKLIRYDSNMCADIFSKSEMESNFYKNYSLFKSLIASAKEHNITEEDILDAIERLEIVEIELTDENPQIIFESLNSTGLGLTNTDLLRNYLLMSLNYDQQERLYHDYWLQIERLLGADFVEQFMIHYLIMKRKTVSINEQGKKANISAKNLYYAFRKQFPNINSGNALEQVEECFRDLYRYANFYQHFLYSKDTVYRNLSRIDKKLYELFYLLEEKTASILVMYLYNKYDLHLLSEDAFAQSLDVCISYAFRCKVCNHSGFTAQFSALTIQRLAPQPIDVYFIDRFWEAITSGRGRSSFPRNDEFIHALKTNEVYNSLKSAGTKYLLYSIEKSLSHSKEIPPYSVGTVEHIMPQNLSKWEDYLSTHDKTQQMKKYLHTLGNLALTAYNTTVSNELFEVKKAEYLKLNYVYTKALASVHDWTSQTIQDRADEMAKKAIEIWTIDERYDREIPIETGVTYTLEADFPAFAGTKPAVVSILGNEVTVSSWSEFLTQVAKTFYTLDSDVFHELIEYPDFPGKKAVVQTTNKSMKRSVRLNKQLFVNLNYSTDDILSIIKCIAEFFDKKKDSNYSDDIWFTIRKRAN